MTKNGVFLVRLLPFHIIHWLCLSSSSITNRTLFNSSSIGNGMREYIYLYCHHFDGTLDDCILSDVYNKSNPDFYDFYYSEDILFKFCLIFRESPSETSDTCNKPFFDFNASFHTNAFLSIPSSVYHLFIIRYFPTHFSKSQSILIRDPQRQNIKNYESEFQRMLGCDRDKLVSWKKKMDKIIYAMLQKNKSLRIKYFKPCLNSDAQILSILSSTNTYLSILRSIHIHKYMEAEALRIKYNVNAKGLLQLSEDGFYKVIADNLEFENRAYDEGNLLFVRGNFDVSLSGFDVTCERGSHSWAPNIFGALLTDIGASVGGYYGNTIFYRFIPLPKVFDFMYVHPAITVPIIDFFRSGELTHDRFKTVLQKSTFKSDEFIYKLFAVVTVSPSPKWFYEFDGDAKNKKKRFYVDESGIIGRKISRAQYTKIHANYLMNCSDLPTQRNEIHVLRTVLNPFFDEFKKQIIEKRYFDEQSEELSS